MSLIIFTHGKNLEKYMVKTILVTGGLGFIGKHFVSELLHKGHNVINIDCYTYAADRHASKMFKQKSNYIESREYIHNLGYLPICDYVVHFAAESHVDNSIADSSKFIHSNITGTHHILELLRRMPQSHRPHLIHISTDEVYGDSQPEQQFVETDVLNPSSPYSASKAAAEHLVTSYARTYGISYNIVRMTNCFGNDQYPEKLIPTICLNIKKDKPIPIHGTGEYIRTWLWVEDAVKAIIAVINSATPYETYNVSGDWRFSVMDIVKFFIDAAGKGETKRVKNRLGQDLDYHINDDKLRNEVGWAPTKGPAELASIIYKNFNPQRFITK